MSIPSGLHPDPSERIRDRCPACGERLLAIDPDGWVICTWAECPIPTAVGDLLSDFGAIRDDAGKAGREGIQALARDIAAAYIGQTLGAAVASVRAAATPRREPRNGPRPITDNPSRKR